MQFSPITGAWLAGEPRALALLPRRFDDRAERAAAAAQAATRRVDPAVLAWLEARAAESPPDPARAASIATLARGGAACVVTGQQAGLFGGPLYTLYKAAAAIVDAQALARDTGVPCVPIFWIQSEDHRFVEVASCAVVDAGGEVVTVAVAPETEAPIAIAARRYGPAVTAALDELEATLDGGDPAVMALLRRHYRPEVSPAHALRGWVEAVFAGTGLLAVDPSDPALASAARPLHRRAIAEAEAVHRLLAEREKALQDAGFKAPVPLRPGAPLSFWHPAGPAGPRHRLEPAGAGFRLVGTDAVVEAAALDQGHLSTSALLRPLLQDTWLPTAAYVGGPGEIAYLAQLPPVYAHLGVPMPMVVPRARFRLVDATARRLLGQLGLDADELAAPRDALLARVARAPADVTSPDALEAALRGPVEAALAGFAPAAEALDKGLGKAVSHTDGLWRDVVGRLVDRYRRTLARQDAVQIDRLDRLRARLAPDGAPQERVLGWPGVAARVGVAALTAGLLERIEPFDGALRTWELP